MGLRRIGNVGLCAIATLVALLALPSAVSAAAPPKVRVISAGFNFTCAVTTDNVPWCWGTNMDNAVGDLTTDDQYLPVRVHKRTGGLLANVRTVSAGQRGSCAITLTAQVWCWGLGYSFPPIDQRGAYHVAGIGHVTQLSVSDSVCARTSSGAAWCWGWNDSGEVGNGTNYETWTPTKIIPSGVVSVQTGGGHTCALKTNHTVWCWGANDDGELGDGTQTQRLTPIRVHGVSSRFLTGVRQVGHPNGAHQCALLATGQPVCWGLDGVGQIGDGGTNTHRVRPVHVRANGTSGANLDHVTSVSTGYGHSCALRRNQTVWCWGWGESGQVGNGGLPIFQLAPVKVRQGSKALGDIVSITAGETNTCALAADGIAWCWGSNYGGALGIGSHQDISRSPVQVKLPR